MEVLCKYLWTLNSFCRWRSLMVWTVELDEFILNNLRELWQEIILHVIGKGWCICWNKIVCWSLLFKWMSNNFTLMINGLHDRLDIKFHFGNVRLLFISVHDVSNFTYHQIFRIYKVIFIFDEVSLFVFV